MKKIFIGLLVFSFLIPVSLLAGFSAPKVDLGLIQDGQTYQTSQMRLTVYNIDTVNDDECYYPNISYHQNQPEHEIPEEWFTFDETEPVCLEHYTQGPNFWFINNYSLSVPTGASAGDYFAYVEMCKVPNGNIGTCYAVTFRFEI